MDVRTEEPAARDRPARRGPWPVIGGLLAVMALAVLLVVGTARGPAGDTALAASDGSGQGAVPAAVDATTALVGRWAMVVTIRSQEPPSTAWVDCDFAADHRVTCISPPGRPALGGEGVWNATGGDGFSVWLTHEHLDADGNPTGAINAQHVGTLTQDGFDTEGVAFVDLRDGSPWLGPVVVSVDSTRIS